MRVTLSLVLPMFSVALAAQQFSLSPPNLLLQHDSISHSVRNSVTLPAGYFAVSQAATSSAVFVAAYTVADSNYDAALLSFDANSLTLNFKASFPLPGNQYPASLASAADGTFTLAVYSDSSRPSSLLYLRLDAHTGASAVGAGSARHPEAGAGDLDVQEFILRVVSKHLAVQEAAGLVVAGQGQVEAR